MSKELSEMTFVAKQLNPTSLIMSLDVAFAKTTAFTWLYSKGLWCEAVF